MWGIVLLGIAIWLILQVEPTNLLELLFYPFLAMAQVLIDALVGIMFETPTIHPNLPVSEIYQTTLIVAVLLAVLVVAVGGLALIIGADIGIPPGEAYRIFPRLVLGLGFSLVALPLLQVGADLSDVFVQTFQPPDAGFGLAQLAGLTTGLVLVWFINSWLLLVLVVIYVIRAAYLTFVAAIAPLLAVAWALPYTRPYAQSFIAGWFALLAVAPLNAIVLTFSLAMLEAGGAFGLQPVSNWIIGVASFSFMIWIPYQLWGVSQSMIGRSAALGTGIGSSWRQRRRGPGGGDGSGGAGGDVEDQRRRRQQRRRDRDRRRGRR